MGAAAEDLARKLQGVTVKIKGVKLHAFVRVRLAFGTSQSSVRPGDERELSSGRTNGVGVGVNDWTWPPSARLRACFYFDVFGVGEEFRICRSVFQRTVVVLVSRIHANRMGLQQHRP